MEKNWLIRTKNNQILGPVSVKKLQNLINDGSLCSDDEVSSGNGYWFYVREVDLVERYINKGVKQGFNPVQEAKTVLSSEYIEEKFDGADDMEVDDVTLVGVNISDLTVKIEEENEIDQIEESTEGSEISVTEIKVDLSLVEEEEVIIPKNKTKKVIKKNFKRVKAKKNVMGAGTLKMIMFLVVVIVFIALYFRSSILSGVSFNPVSLVISDTYAQTNIIKKKVVNQSYQ